MTRDRKPLYNKGMHWINIVRIVVEVLTALVEAFDKHGPTPPQ